MFLCVGMLEVIISNVLLLQSVLLGLIFRKLTFEI